MDYSKLANLKQYYSNAGAPPGREEAGAHRALSMSHISPLDVERAHAEFVKGASRITVKRDQILRSRKGGGIRGKIKTFSQGSKLRLIHQINSIEKGILPHFLTLTYPDDYPHDMKIVKKQIDTLFKRMFRKWPKIGLIWRLEAQKRGAPHFHCLIWGLSGENSSSLVYWMALNWYEIVNSGDINHFLFHMGKLKGSQKCISWAKSWKSVMFYTAKYMTKVDDSEVVWNTPGRFWGKRGLIPWGEIERVALTDKQAMNFIRIIRKCKKLNFRSCNRSITGYFELSDYYLERLDRLLDLKPKKNHVKPNSFPVK